MKIGKIIELEDAYGFTPTVDGVEYTELSGARVFIPMRLLVRLYEGAKWHHEKTSTETWDEFCNSLFAKDGK